MITTINKIEMVAVNNIKPYFRNPRKNDKTVDALVQIIPKVGFNVPILLDRNNVIVKGHSRWFASIKLGMEAVPCVYTDADEEIIKLDRIADNRISEFSEWVNEELAHELDMLDDFEALKLLDFNLPQLDSLDGLDFTFDTDDGLTDEERRKKYQDYLDKQAKITDEKGLDKAKKDHEQVGKNQEQYYKFVCPKCGNIHFAKASEVWLVDKDKE